MSNCPTCGYALNSGSESACPLCGDVEAGREAGQGKKTIMDTSASQIKKTKHTILGRQPGKGPNPQNPAGRPCINCSYLMRQDSKFCPECGAPAQSSGEGTTGTASQPDQGDARQATRRLEDFQAPPTVHPVKLIPVNHPGKEILSSGEDAWELRRQDIDLKDDSISEQTHLRITRDAASDQWIINNVASNKALFIQVIGDVVLRQDMVILIGQHHLYRVSLDGQKS